MSDRPAAVSPATAKLVGAIALAGLAVVFVVPLAARCLTMADEGYLLLQALDLANGKVLYRDMDAFVTPGMWFLLAFVFELVEPSVWASRIPVVLGYVALIALAYRIPARLVGTRAGLASVACMMVATVWAFPAWTFAFYSPFSVLFALVSLDRLLAYRARVLGLENRGAGARRALLEAGLWLGCSILFKQNYGVFALVGTCLALWVVRSETGEPLGRAFSTAVRESVWLAVAMAVVALPTVAYLALTGALDEAFYSLVVHPFEFSGRHGIAYLGLVGLFEADVLSETLDIMTYGAQPIYRAPIPPGFVESTRLIERMHVLLYWFPPLIAILGLTLAFTGRDKATTNEGPLLNGGLLSVLLVSFMVFLGTFPRADFNHLINVYQPIVVAGAVTFGVLFERLATGAALKRWTVASLLSVALVLFGAISAYWYYALVKTMSFEVEGRRGGVKIAPPEAASLRNVMLNLDQLSTPGEALLTVPDIAMLNFLAERPMPSAYYNLYEHHIAHDGGAAVAEGAEAAGATVAVTRLNAFFSDRTGFRDYAPSLARYIDTRFEQQYTIGRAEYLVYTKREVPVPEESFVSLLDDCTVGNAKNEIEDHLLFRTLYQTMGPGHGKLEDSLAVRCRAEIPKQGGRFVFQLDYPLPVKLRSPSTLFTEALVIDAGTTQRVFSQLMEVKTAKSRRMRFPAAREFEVDLSEFAGKRIELVLRATRSGRVVMSNSAIRSFGARWQHPRIVAN
ncbi:MAG: glycosyltransferase family 39 protein [Myxococcota bacterium]|jgi:hypothetical protein|nr:glycosyltransferase family 39 protein [Myxococcota bacterium]